jgi:hypothetical protein
MTIAVLDALAGPARIAFDIITRKPSDGLALDAVGQLDGRLATDTRARLSMERDGLAAVLSGDLRDG